MQTKEIPQFPDGLLSLIQQVKETYIEPPAPVKRKRGRCRTYSGLSFLLLAVVAVAMRTFKESELCRLLQRDIQVRSALGFDTVPHRRTIGRRLTTLLPEAEAQVSALGEVIVKEVQPGEDHHRVSAIDGRMYQANGPAWHKKDRLTGVVPSPLRHVDTESKWSKSGYRGWVQGYRLVLQGLVFPCPVPLFAAWRPNNENEASIAAQALADQRLKVTDVMLGDTTFGFPSFTKGYAKAGGWVLTPLQLPTHHRSWKHDLYAYRQETIELLFQRIIQACDLKQCPVHGLMRNGAFVIASVWVYQVIFLTNYRQGKAAAEIKQILDDARWRIPT